MPYNEPANLPTNPGPIDPPILTQGPADYPSGPSRSFLDFWTRMDPNMGYIRPSIEITPADVVTSGEGDIVGGGGNTRSGPGRFFSNVFSNMPIVQLIRSLTGGNSNTGSFAGGGITGGFGGGGPGGGIVGGGGNLGNAPSDVRFSENSGTGNWQADQTIKDFLLKGGYTGRPNQGGDAGRTSFDPSSGFAGRINPDTGMLERVKTSIDPSRVFQRTQGGPPITTNPASLAAYNAWLLQQPEYAAWATAAGGNGPNQLPPLTISGPPGG